MRRQLMLVFGAVSLMVAVAFVLPLAVLVANTAEDRAIDAARVDAAGIVPALVAEATRAQIESAAGATETGRNGRMTIVTSTGWTIGPDVEMSERLANALDDGASGIGPVEGGMEVVVAAATGPGELSAVRIFVPDSELHRGKTTAWAALGVVAITLVAIAVAVADRLARSIVRPAQRLASAAHRLGDGHLDSRVKPDGPPELVELSNAFNSLGAQVSSMLVRERELVAELSHRLRTPLTKLRMRLEHVQDESLARDLRQDLDDITVVVNDLIAEARTSLTTIGESCDAAIVIAERVNFWAALAEDTDRPWSFDRGPSPTWVPISASALQAVVDVLIENVFTHTPDGTRFEVGFEHRITGMRLWVSDAGEGFEPNALQRGSSGADSTGLGLDIARSTATDAGGSLSLAPSALGGAKVMVQLPRLPHDRT